MGYILFLQEFRDLFGGLFDSFVLHITQLGESMLTFLLLGLVYWCVNRNAGAYMALNVGLASTYSQVLKNFFKVERPWVQNPEVHPVPEALANAGGYSFPSGHTTRATAIWGALGTYMRKNKDANFLGVLCWAVALLVGFSRNYLGVHTLWDVLAAFVMCLVIMFVIEKALNWCEGGTNRDYIVAFWGSIICFLPMLKFGCLSNAGAGMGAFIGWVLERHFVQFEGCKTSREKAWRFAIGALGIIYIRTVLSNLLIELLPATKYASFLTSFILLMFIMFVYPFFFSKKTRYVGGVVLLVFIVVVQGGIAAYITEKSENQQQESIERQMHTETKQSVQTLEDSGNVLQTPIPIIVAHRGYSSVFPENTLPALAGAIDIQADMVELDVQQTKDGVIVLYHDTELAKIGLQGRIADFTYAELAQIDVGSAFMPEYAGVNMPTLAEALTLIKDSDLYVYLELKDIGDVDGYEEAVFAVAKECGMVDRCIFASFNQNYLQCFEEMDQEIKTLYNVSECDSNLPQTIVVDYYGINVNGISQEVIDAIHTVGKEVYVWTVDAPEDMVRMVEMGVDGIVTNKPGIARVVVHPEYSFVAERYSFSFEMPGLYGMNVPMDCNDVVVQGMTFVEDKWLISAYSKSNANSVLFVLNEQGDWLTTLDLGFVAHTGGIGYDSENNLLWVTGAAGTVNALDWDEMKSKISGGNKAEIVSSVPVKYCFDAGLTNHNGSKVASFLDVLSGEIYVGSYVKGAEGLLRTYDLSDPSAPILLTEQRIPEKVQGITFVSHQDKQYILMCQSEKTNDSKLLVYEYDAQLNSFVESLQTYNLPEGAEQPEILGDNICILFDSAARPHYETARLRNDQVIALDLKELLWE